MTPIAPTTRTGPTPTGPTPTGPAITRIAAAMAGAAAMLCAAAPARADDPATPASPAVLQSLYACRSISDAAARLACYDAQVVAVENAVASRDIRVVDRETVRETRRGLFGFSIGRLFGGDGDVTTDAEEEAAEAEEVREIEARIASARSNANGQWIITLDNGQRWVQTDTRTTGFTPRQGDAIRIRRAALGSYMANVGNNPGFRIRREQ